MPEAEKKQQHVDVERVLFEKNPKLAKKLPRFLINYLKRVVHQDDLNDALNHFGHLKGYDFVNEGLKYMNITYHIHQSENLPANGRYVIAANHPLGGLDGTVLIKAMHDHFGDVRFLVNDILMNIKQFDPVFVPINKHGGHSREAVKMIEEVYKSDMQVLMFPSGLASRRIKGKITDLEWKKMFLTKAIEYQRDIIPVYIDGRNSNFFYNLSNFRKWIGIKANIEMIYLPDEMFRQRNTCINLVIGKPISYTSFTDEKTPAERAANIKEKVYSLKQMILSAV